VHAAGQDVCLYRTGPVVQSSAAADQCVTVYDFPDMGWRVCADVWAEDCALYEYRATFLGTERNCIGPAVPGATCGPYLGPVQPCVNPRDADCLGYVNQNALPMVNPVCLVDASLSAGAASPPPCYDIYRRTDVHTFTLVQRNSCSAEAYTCPTPGAPLDQCQPLVSQAAAVAGAPEPQCLQYYRETEVGPYRHVQRNSCESEHYLCDEEAVPYLLSKPTLDDLVVCTWESTGLVGPVLASSQPVCHRAGQGELQSRSCVDPASTDCTVYVERTTGVSSEWWCSPSGGHGSWT
jgi:hypothetical protein